MFNASLFSTCQRASGGRASAVAGFGERQTLGSVGATDGPEEAVAKRPQVPGNVPARAVDVGRVQPVGDLVDLKDRK